MRIQTILNRVKKFKSFTSGQAQLVEHDGDPRSGRKRRGG